MQLSGIRKYRCGSVGFFRFDFRVSSISQIDGVFIRFREHALLQGVCFYHSFFRGFSRALASFFKALITLALEGQSTLVISIVSEDLLVHLDHLMLATNSSFFSTPWLKNARGLHLTVPWKNYPLGLH